MRSTNSNLVFSIFLLPFRAIHPYLDDISIVLNPSLRNSPFTVRFDTMPGMTRYHGRVVIFHLALISLPGPHGTSGAARSIPTSVEIV